jgi:hypothetical protein
MKDREETIAHEMKYCQHYGHGQGVEMVCKAGMNLKQVQKVVAGSGGITWGPCIDGHTLPNVTEHCQHWIQRTREMGEKRADAIERSIQMMTTVLPVVQVWREKPPCGKSGTIECPICKGQLHLSQSAYNGHVHAR